MKRHGKLSENGHGHDTCEHPYPITPEIMEGLVKALAASLGEIIEPMLHAWHTGSDGLRVDFHFGRGPITNSLGIMVKPIDLEAEAE